MGFRIEGMSEAAPKMRAATAADHQVVARQEEGDQKTFFVVNVPVPSHANGLEGAPNPYFLPTFEALDDAAKWRRDNALDGYSITELVLKRRGRGC